MPNEAPDTYKIQNELVNIKNMIQLTQDNLTALMNRFSGLQDPPPMYIIERQDLSNKLEELKQREIQLTQLLTETKENEKSNIKIIRAHLPNQQVTRVRVFSGLYEYKINIVCIRQLVKMSL